MFTTRQRDQVNDRMLALAEADERVVAAAVVGSMAATAGDAWSDLDLTFGVSGADAVDAVLEEFSRCITEEFDAVFLFDLVRGTSIYRVFLLPGRLQVDLSFTPARDFGPRGPRFRLLFGAVGREERPQSPSAREMVGLATHHAVRAHVCLARGRVWQAEFWLSYVRDYALSLACLRNGLDPAYARDTDSLGEDLLAAAARALPWSVERAELLRALAEAAELLMNEVQWVDDVPERLSSELGGLIADARS